MTRDGVASIDTFSGWYAHHVEGVLRTVTVAAADRAVAEEAVAEAFARAYADWHRVAALERPVGWVVRVALNQVRDGWRRRRTERAAEHRLTGAAAREDVGVDPDLWAAVARLPERQRHAVALRYVADMSESEIAEVLGVRRGTVASNLHDARAALAAVIGVEQWEVTS